MIKNFLFAEKKGFTLVEIIVSVAIFAVIFFVLISSFLAMNASNSKTTADREISENAERVLEEIVYEIKSAKSVYTPTTTASQLSLETHRYMPVGQDDTYIDFFMCGNAICIKKEFQDAYALTPDSIKITNLAFSQIANGTASSVQINLTASYSGSGSGQDSSSISLTSTASVRNY